MPITESDVESYIVLQLAALGWQVDPKKPGRNVFRQSPRTQAEKEKLGRLKPDFVLYSDRDSQKATAIIEAKKPNLTLAVALEQGKRYARLLSAPLVIATDGYRVKTWHMKQESPLFYNTGEVDDLFDLQMANYFASNHIYESFSEERHVSKKELIGKFKKANDILRAEGLDAGIVRFSEFANLMFLKLKMEGGEEISGHTWKDIENKNGRAQLSAVRAMLASLRQSHSALFEQTKITQPARIEKLIEILSSFRLSRVRDDVKGVAFECFIHSYTQGLKNDLGQYFTPRHIIKMIVDFLRPELGETIYDPFCGTGGMLIECFRYIQQHGVDSDKQRQQLCQNTIYGRDNSSVARIAMMNMIMFGDGHSNVKRGDSYAKCENDKYDIVITNIPFSQQTEYTEGYPIFPLEEKNGDSIGVQHCLVSMKNTNTARAAIIVPIGFIHKPALKGEREYIYKNFHLERVVELTPKCFNPYTEQQTAVLMLRRRHRPSGQTVYYRVKNDGFSQDGYRIPVPGVNDIDKVMEKEGGENAAITSADGWKYKKLFLRTASRKYKQLRSLATIISGDSISPKTEMKYTIGGKYPIAMVADLAANHIDYCLDKFNARINDFALANKKPYLYPAQTIVIPSSGKAALLNHRALLKNPTYLSSTLTGIVAGNSIHPYYLFYWLLHWDAEEGTYDLGYPGLSPSVIGDIPIPIKTESEQEKIVRVIAKAVEEQQQFKASHCDIMSEKL